MEIEKETNASQDALSAEIAAFLKERRIVLGLSQEQAAMMIYGNIEERGRISKIENGKKNISVKTLYYFFAAYKCWWRPTE